MNFSRLLSLVVLLFGLAGGVYYFYFQEPKSLIVLDKTPFQSAYIIPTPKSLDQGQVTAYFILQTGEAEMTGPEGMLHYIEHLAAWSAFGKPDDAFKRHANAWTSGKSVGYWFKSARSDLKISLANLSKIFSPFSLERKFAMQERDIVQREYDLSVANSPESQLYHEMNNLLYEGSGFSRSVIGRPADIAQFDLAQAQAMHAGSHLADDAVLVVVGNVSADEVYAALPEIKKADLKPVVMPEFKITEAVTKIIDKPDVVVASKLLWRRVVALSAPKTFDEIVLQCNLLRDILMSNLQGGLEKALRYDQFLAREIGVGCHFIDNNHVEVQFFAHPDKNKSLTQLLAGFEKSFFEIATAGIPQETFNRVKTRFDLGWPKKDDDVAVRKWMEEHVLDRVSQQQMPSSLDAILKLSDALKLSDLNEFLKNMQAGGRTVVSKLGKEIEGQ